MINFSVIVPIYRGVDLNSLERAVNSLLNQTVKPDEILVVIEPTLTTDVKQYINSLSGSHDVVQLEYVSSGVGLGKALRRGVTAASCEFIARMDADDICKPERFEKQIEYMENHTNTDIVGSYTGEFSETYNRINNIKKVPTIHDEIITYAQFRSPFNHPTVFFRREAVINAGNYNSMPGFEDYDLWIRMIQQGARLANIPEVLVYSHAGAELSSRRGGLSYLRSEIRFQRKVYQMGFITMLEFLRNCILRGTVRLLPRHFRYLVYQYIRNR